jgi:CBS-domain-containing membrane protein
MPRCNSSGKKGLFQKISWKPIKRILKGPGSGPCRRRLMAFILTTSNYLGGNVMHTKKLRDLIIPLSDYPHLPYWGTLREAIAQLNVAYATGHHTVLVFDEAYKLVGMLLEKDILKGLEPRFAQHYQEGVPILWDQLLKSGVDKQLDRPIKEFMSKAKATLDAEDSVLKASHIMVNESLYVLPVMEGDKLIGIVRMGDVFHTITTAVLEL